MLPENTRMLCQQSRLLLLNHKLNPQLLQSLRLHLLQLLVSLRSVDRQFLLPQILHIALMLQLSHTPSLLIHLLQFFVLCKLQHQLLFKLLFNAPLLNDPLLFYSLGKICRSLEFLSLSIFFCNFLSYTFLSQLFPFFKVEFIAQILLKFLLCPPL